MRGRVCRLQLLLALASAVILGFKSRGTHDHILLSQIRDPSPLTWRERCPYLHPPGTGWPSYTPGTDFPFRHLLRLAGIRWRYSNPPPHGGFAGNYCRTCSRSATVEEVLTVRSISPYTRKRRGKSGVTPVVTAKRWVLLGKLKESCPPPYITQADTETFTV
jgi:hypothetical protein